VSGAAVERPALVVFLASAVAAAFTSTLAGSGVLEALGTDRGQTADFAAQVVCAAALVAAGAAAVAWVLAARASRLSVRLQILACLLLAGAAMLAAREWHHWLELSSSSRLVGVGMPLLAASSLVAWLAAGIASARLLLALRSRRRVTVTSAAGYLEALDAHLRTSGSARRRIVSEAADHLACAAEAGDLGSALARFGAPADVAAAFETRAAVASARVVQWGALLVAAGGCGLFLHELDRVWSRLWIASYATMNAGVGWTMETPGGYNAPTPVERFDAPYALLPPSFRGAQGLAVVLYALVALLAALTALACARRLPAAARGLTLAVPVAAAISVVEIVQLNGPWSFNMPARMRWELLAMGVALGLVGIAAGERVLFRPRVGTVVALVLALAAPLPALAAWRTPLAPTGSFVGLPVTNPDRFGSGNQFGYGPAAAPGALALDGKRALVTWVGTVNGDPIAKEPALRAIVVPHSGVTTGPLASLRVPRLADPLALRSLAIAGPAAHPTLAWSSPGGSVVWRAGTGAHAVGGPSSSLLFVRLQGRPTLALQRAGRIELRQAPSWSVGARVEGRLVDLRAFGGRLYLLRSTPGGLALEVRAPRLALVRTIHVSATHAWGAVGPLGAGRFGLAYSGMVGGVRASRLLTVGPGRPHTSLVTSTLPCAAPLAVGLVAGRPSVLLGIRCSVAEDGILQSTIVEVRGAAGWTPYWQTWDDGSAQRAWISGGGPVTFTRFLTWGPHTQALFEYRS
jgi:hypothetical protein